jgi:hypothetical protein
MRIADRRGVRLTLAMLLPLSWAGPVPTLTRAAAPAGPAQLPPQAQLALRMLDSAEQEARRPGADPSDISFAAQRLGFDADKIFQFVRDQTSLEPYSGILLGARGVLAGGAGNALDRALLLQAMLTQSGIPCRLMRGTLPQAAAARVLQQYLSSPKSHLPAPIALDPSSSSTKLMERAGVNDQLIAEIKDRCATRSAGFWRTVSAQTQERSAFLSAALKAAGFNPQPAATVQDALLKSLATHYWVQRQDASQNWIDLDPTFADSEPGKTAGEAGAAVEAIAPEEHHHLDISLVYRTRSGSEIKQEQLLNQTVDAADAPFTPIAFAVQSADANLPNPAGLDNKQKVELIRKMKKFQGVIRVGGTMSAGRPFDLEGHTYDVNPGGVIGNASGVGSGVSGGFGGFGGALGGGARPKQENTFVDARVVMTLRSPGREPTTQTRVLVSAAHPAPPLLNWEVYLQPQLNPPTLVRYQMLDYLARQRPFVQAMFAPIGKSWPRPDTWPYPVNSNSFALLRDQALRRTMGAATGVVPLMDHPNLLLFSHQVAINVAGDSTEGRWGIDLVEMDLNFVPKDAASEPAALAAAIRQGAAESSIEGPFLAGAFPGHNVSSAAGRFDLARIQGGEVRVVRAQDAANLKALGWSDAEVQEIAALEPADHQLVATAPIAGQSSAWWSIRPDGATVARAGGGMGQAETDYMELTLNIECKVLCALEGYELYKEKNTYAFTSFLICAAMQGVGGGIEMAAEESEFEGIGFIISAIDLALWGYRGMNKPKE